MHGQKGQPMQSKLATHRTMLTHMSQGSHQRVQSMSSVLAKKQLSAWEYRSQACQQKAGLLVKHECVQHAKLHVLERGRFRRAYTVWCAHSCSAAEKSAAVQKAQPVRSMSSRLKASH
mmetsp:Transcript_22909/g.59845  ORF Transcript_22909/g.59845 Transcript_22909/m.59845 type:complete len:118 (+) Transcript_22909:1126-1479(+)